MLSNSLSLSDLDHAFLTSATVTISGNHQPLEDQLSVAAGSGITYSYDAASGILSLSGTASISVYETALRSVAYENTSDQPVNTDRTVSFSVSDGVDSSNFSVRVISVSPVNDAPVLTTTDNTPLIYTENDGTVSVFGLIDVIDADDVVLTSATVSISGNYTAAEDVLQFNDQPGITGMFDPLTGSLVLSGNAPLADYATALANVAYVNNSDNPNTSARQITVSVFDGDLQSNSLVRDINIVAENDAPLITGLNSDPLIFSENDPATVVAQTISLSDTDSNFIDSASIEIIGGFNASEDQLLFTDSALITGIWDQSTGRLSLSGTDTIANYQAALRSIAYINSSDDPDVSLRTVQFSVNDGDINSSVAIQEIQVLSVNDEPSGTDNTIITLEDTPYRFTPIDFGFTDAVELHSFQSIIVEQIPVTGTLVVDEINVSTGDVIDTTDIASGKFSYVPEPDTNGTNTAEFSFRVTDSGGSAQGGMPSATEANTITIDITAVDDAPQGGDSTVQIVEDTVYVLQTGDFEFSDPQDSQQFSGITIDRLPDDVSVTLNGVPLTVGDFIGVADIDASLLQYTPAPNATDSESFEYFVHDTGSALNGGSAVSDVASTIRFEIESTNDLPQLVSNSATVDEGSEFTIDTDLLSANDSDSSAQELEFILAKLPDSGVLSLNGMPLGQGSTFTLAQIAANELSYRHDGSETAADFFEVQLFDNADHDSVPVLGRFSINIVDIQDPPPELTEDSFSILSGAQFSSDNGSELESGFATVLGNDAGFAAGFTVSLVQAPQHGNLEFNTDGTFLYTHDGSDILSDGFSYRVTNEDGVSSVANVVINIEPPLGKAVDEPTLQFQPQIQSQEDTVETDNETVDMDPADEVTAEEQTGSILTAVNRGSEQLPDSTEVLNVFTRFERFESVGQHQRINSLEQIETIQHNRIRAIEFNAEDAQAIPTFEVVLETDINTARNVTGNDRFADALSSISDDLQNSQERDSKRYQNNAEAVFGSALSLTAIVLSWTLRTGSLAASLMAMKPLWAQIDPVKVTGAAKEEDHEDSEDMKVESIFDERTRGS